MKTLLPLLLLSVVGCSSKPVPTLSTTQQWTVAVDCPTGRSYLSFTAAPDMVPTAIMQQIEFTYAQKDSEECFVAIRKGYHPYFLHHPDDSTSDCTTSGDNSACISGNNNSVTINGVER